MNEYKSANGILLINNLNFGNQRPCLRFDDNFFDTVSKKLNIVLEKARCEGLVPVFCGVFTQKSWDTSMFSYLVRVFQESEAMKPCVVLDEPFIQRSGQPKSNTIPQILSVVGSANIVDMFSDLEVHVNNHAYHINMVKPGAFVLSRSNLEGENKHTLINSEDDIPSLVRVRLDEKDKSASVLKITEDSVEEFVVDGGIAPIDDVAFDVAEEIKDFDSQMVERLRELMKRDSSSSEKSGDSDLKDLCDELNVSGDVKNILFELKDEAVAEDLSI